MADTNRHNGFTNYETWAVALWIDNEQGSSEQARGIAQDAHDNPNESKYWTTAEARLFTLADALKDWVTDELLPDLGASLAADLLNAAVSEVDWHDLAEHYLSDLDDEEQDAANNACSTCGDEGTDGLCDECREALLADMAAEGPQ